MMLSGDPGETLAKGLESSQSERMLRFEHFGKKDVLAGKVINTACAW